MDKENEDDWESRRQWHYQKKKKNN